MIPILSLKAAGPTSSRNVHDDAGQRTPEYRRTFQSAGEHGSTRSPAQAPLSRCSSGAWKGAPGVWGSWTCPASPVSACICSPCPIHLCLQTPPFTQHLQLLRFAVTASSLEPLTSSKEAPSPCTESLLPLGTPLPLGAPLPLVRAQFILHPQKTETHRRQGLFGLFCTS